MTAIFTNPIHLYRSLLRETTYLFDSNARTYFHQYITSSFRAQLSIVGSDTKKNPSHDVEYLPSLGERRQLKRGRKLLSTLWRANQGYKQPLENVLGRTYGRKGRRRRDLMAEIMLREPTEKIQANVTYKVGSPEQHQQPQSKRFGKDWKPPPKFDALMRSQSVLQGHLAHKKKITIKPTVEEKNAWGKPMPLCRIKNKTKQWYTKNAQILLPYLSEKEFEEIKERAESKTVVIPNRRPIAKVDVLTRQEEESRQGSFTDLTTALVSGPVKQRSVRQRRLEGNPHNLKPRFLRRLYTRSILRHTPVAMARPDGLGIMFKWDNGQTKVLETVRITHEKDSVQALALFEATKDLNFE